MARSPAAAALVHQVGSLLVLLNAMRLLWFERWHQRWPGRIETALGNFCGRWLQRCRPAVTTARWCWHAKAQLARLAFYLLLAAYLTQIVVFVQPDEVAIVKRFGRLHAVLAPGPHLRLPPPWDTIVRERPDRVRTVEVGLRRTNEGSELPMAPIEWNTPHDPALREQQESEAVMLTGDQSLVELAATVQYRVSDVHDFCFGVREPPRVLKTVLEGVIRELLAARPLLIGDPDGDWHAEILTGGRAELEEQIRLLAQQRADRLGLGVEILPQGVCLVDVHPPLAVVPSFRDVSSAFKEKERMRNEAQGFYREKLIQAAGQEAWRRLSAEGAEVDDPLWKEISPQLAGEAAAELNNARAFSEQRQNLAAGDAERFALKEAAHHDAPQLTEWRLLLETLAEALPGKKKLILDDKAAGRRHLLMGVTPGTAGSLLPIQPEASSEER